MSYPLVRGDTLRNIGRCFFSQGSNRVLYEGIAARGGGTAVVSHVNINEAAGTVTLQCHDEGGSLCRLSGSYTKASAEDYVLVFDGMAYRLERVEGYISHDDSNNSGQCLQQASPAAIKKDDDDDDCAVLEFDD